MQAEEQQTQSFLMSVERERDGGGVEGGGAAAQTDVDNNHQFLSVALVFINLRGDGVGEGGQMKRHRWTQSDNCNKLQEEEEGEEELQ